MDWSESSLPTGLPPRLMAWREAHQARQATVEELERAQIAEMLLDGFHWNKEAELLAGDGAGFERYRYTAGQHAATVRERRKVARFFADSAGRLSAVNVKKYLSLRGNGTREPKTWRSFVLAAAWLDAYFR